MSDDELPFGIFLLAGLQFLQAIGLFLVGGLWLLIPFIGLIISIPYGIAGVFGLYIAIGLFTLQDYAWAWAFLLNLFGFVLFLLGLNWFGVILSAIIVIYLNLPDVKNKFN
jgi:hypothetical protein